MGVFHTGVLPGAYRLISLLAGVLAGLLFYFLGTTLLRRDLLIFLQLASFLLAQFVVERAWRYGNHRGVGWLLRIFTYVVRIFGRNQRGRAGVRAMDHFVNATLFNGYAWESVSSHAWREREKSWAKLVILIADNFQPGHCQRANKREQPIVDFIIKRKLNDQTIF